MSASFDLDHAKLRADPRFTELAERLESFSPIKSGESFNRYCRNACSLWREQFPEKLGTISERFTDLRRQIDSKTGDVIETGWGGVVITLHEHSRIEKYLVINQGRYLALEKHEQKDEQLEITEGGGLVLWRGSPRAALIAEPLTPTKRFHFKPGVEHCLIATENLLVFERSTDPKGMDRDLIFIFEPEDA